jgi:hypothetical protein
MMAVCRLVAMTASMRTAPVDSGYIPDGPNARELEQDLRAYGVGRGSA